MADKHDVQLRTKLLEKIFPSIDVVDNLDTDNANRPLSARQGKKLKELIGSSSSSLTSFDIQVVSVLPSEGEKGILYLVPSDPPSLGKNNEYDEYIWIDSKFEKLGSFSTDIDLTILKEDINRKVEDIYISSNTTYGDYGLKLNFGTDYTKEKTITIPRATMHNGGLMSPKDKAVLDFTDVYNISSINLNTIDRTGTYKIIGENTTRDNNLPIMNSGSGHTVEGILKVFTSYIGDSGKDNDCVVTQMLSMTNRYGADGHTWMRTGHGNNPTNLTWETWEKLQGIFEKGIFDSLTELDTWTDNGMYSGIYTGPKSTNWNGFEAYIGMQLLVVTNNAYAAASVATGNPVISQFIYIVNNNNIPEQFISRYGKKENGHIVWKQPKQFVQSPLGKVKMNVSDTYGIYMDAVNSSVSIGSDISISNKLLSLGGNTNGEINEIRIGSLFNITQNGSNKTLIIKAINSNIAIGDIGYSSPQLRIGNTDNNSHKICLGTHNNIYSSSKTDYIYVKNAIGDVYLGEAGIKITNNNYKNELINIGDEPNSTQKGVRIQGGVSLEHGLKIDSAVGINFAPGNIGGSSLIHIGNNTFITGNTTINGTFDSVANNVLFDSDNSLSIGEETDSSKVYARNAYIENADITGVSITNGINNPTKAMVTISTTVNISNAGLEIGVGRDSNNAININGGVQIIGGQHIKIGTNIFIAGNSDNTNDIINITHNTNISENGLKIGNNGSKINIGTFYANNISLNKDGGNGIFYLNGSFGVEQTGIQSSLDYQQLKISYSKDGDAITFTLGNKSATLTLQ